MIINKKKIILIIEDEKPLRQALEKAINRENFATLVAQDGEEGLQVALASHPDLILLDIIMPKMNGVIMLKKLREDTWGKTVPVLLLTNDSNPEHIRETLKDDASDYLIKSDWKLEDIIKRMKKELNM